VVLPLGAAWHQPTIDVARCRREDGRTRLEPSRLDPSEPAVIGWGIGLESPLFFLLQARVRFCE
jgi:hypothetical protein